MILERMTTVPTWSTMSRLLLIASLLLAVAAVPLQTVTSADGIIVDGLTFANAEPSTTVITHTLISSDKIIFSTETVTFTNTDDTESPVTIPNSGTGVIRTALPTPSAVEGSINSSKRSGAIAGGVIGAVAVAVIAALLFFRLRKRNSPKLGWRKGSEHKWQNLDAKAGQVPDPYADRPYDGSNPVTPFVPLFIREKHKPSANDPFSDPYNSPSGGSTRGHHRNQSSFASFGSSHYRDESVEMTPTRDAFVNKEEDL